jgi:hypothetical protein
MFTELTGRELADVVDSLPRDNGNLFTIINRLGVDAAAQGTTFTMIRIPEKFSNTDKWEVAVDNGSEVVKLNGTILTSPMTDNDPEIGSGIEDWCEARGITYP